MTTRAYRCSEAAREYASRHTHPEHGTCAGDGLCPEYDQAAADYDAAFSLADLARVADALGMAPLSGGFVSDPTWPGSWSIRVVLVAGGAPAVLVDGPFLFQLSSVTPSPEEGADVGRLLVHAVAPVKLYDLERVAQTLG